MPGITDGAVLWGQQRRGGKGGWSPQGAVEADHPGLNR